MCGTPVFNKQVSYFAFYISVNNSTAAAFIKAFNFVVWKILLGFPKGHIEAGETKEETALREVLEETGIRIKLIDGFECISKYKIQNKIEKTVSIFVGTTQDTSTSIQTEEIEDYIWLTYDRALSLLKFENDKNIITSAHEFLNKNNYI